MAQIRTKFFVTLGIIGGMCAIQNTTHATQVVEINGEKNFNDYIAHKEYVVVKFHSPLCPHCKSFEPIFRKAAEGMPEVTFLSIDITKSANKKLMSEYPFNTIPTIFYIEKGSLVGTPTGSAPTAAHVQKIVAQTFNLKTTQNR